jgi:hypothetical protein
MFFFKSTGIFFEAARVFLNEHKEKARAPRMNTRHLNPSPWQCYPLCWRIRHAQKKTGLVVCVGKPTDFTQDWVRSFIQASFTVLAKPFFVGPTADERPGRLVPSVGTGA